MKRERAVVDAGNILYLGRPPERKPSIKNVFAVMSAVTKSGRKPIVIVDRAMFSAVGAIDDVEKLLVSPGVISIPLGSDAARCVLDAALQYDAIVVSNNTYAEYWDEYPWIEVCRMPVALLDGSVRLLEGRFKDTTYHDISGRRTARTLSRAG